jgi:hypothetical protein
MVGDREVFFIKAGNGRHGQRSKSHVDPQARPQGFKKVSKTDSIRVATLVAQASGVQGLGYDPSSRDECDGDG